MATWHILLLPLVIALVIFAWWSIFYADNNVLSGIGWLTLALVGCGSYLFGSLVFYSAASRKLGYTCELNPLPAPRSAHQGASYLIQFVISGTFHARAFTLYREIDRSSRGLKGNPVAYTVVEWTGGEIHLPTFTLRVSALAASSLQNRMAETMLRAAGMNSADDSRIELEPGTNLSTRARLSGPDAQTVRSFFTRTVCNELDALVSDATINGEPGLLVTREVSTSPMPWDRRGKFPLPWQIEDYLARAERIRRVFAF
jgi:hypothetical protein